MKLTSELVPSTCFYTNLRSELSTSEWDKIRKASYKKADHKCEICGDTGKNQGFKHDLESHEIWDYILENNIRTQKLLGVISLCPRCHKVKHPGLANIKGEIKIVYNQLVSVNEMTLTEAKIYLDIVFEEWRERSKYNWSLDISWLDNNL